MKKLTIKKNFKKIKEEKRRGKKRRITLPDPCLVISI